jgi:putative acetyltransferase
MIRLIEQHDDQPLAQLIRTVFREFKIDKPGTVYTDPTTDHLFELFQTPGSVYWVAESEGVMAGGCGIFPTPGLPDGCVELVKLYVSAEFRNKGLGLQLMEKCFESALGLGYSSIYLETLPELRKAVSMYERAGFRHINQRQGNSGHYSCNIWMMKRL